ncbi:MAG: hypothetical protein EP343_26640 [Deltaproteobacteria bacterium]|nr:MAG: hypothetical protein EP343_26640 [Deltaproteobacteria bacterium]
MSDFPSPEQPKPSQRPVLQQEQPKPSFEKLRVSEVYCPACKTAQPVKEVLGYEDADVTVFHVVCQHCNSVVGQRTISDASVEDEAA